MLKILRSMGTLHPCTGGTIWCDLSKVDDDDVQIVEAADLRHSRPPSVGHPSMASNNRRENLSGYRLTAIICYRTLYVNTLFRQLPIKSKIRRPTWHIHCLHSDKGQWPVHEASFNQTAPSLYIPETLAGC